MKAIETRQLCYRYSDGTQALNDVTLCVERGSITGILGANGAGKSTLFQCLMGILRPQSGELFVFNEPIAYTKKGLLKLRQQVGLVFQDPEDQLFSADVYRDVSFGAVNLGLPEDEVRQRVEKALDATGLAALSRKPVHTLSYGQKKRAAIAGILVMQPRIMILDEPTAGLDPEGVSQMIGLIRDLKDKGITILIATHDMDLVPLLCDAVYLLAEGKTAAAGTPEELFSRPDLLRQHHLRLPRIAHLMEILHEKDGLSVRSGTATIGGARREILRLLEEAKWT